MEESPPKAAETPPTEVVINNIDSPHLEVIYVDGARGFITPHNVLRATFFEEQYPTPAVEKHQLTHKGGGEYAATDGKETVVDSDGVINVTRENMVTLILSRKGLADLIPWLNQKLNELENAERTNLKKAGK